MSLTPELLREHVDYDAETGIFYSTNKVRRWGLPVGRPQSRGYVNISIAGTTYLAHRLAWFFVHGEWPENNIDHINGVKTDNRIINLRDVTQAENLQAYHASKKMKLPEVSA